MGCIQTTRTQEKKKKKVVTAGGRVLFLVGCSHVSFFPPRSPLNGDASGMEPCQWADWISKCYFTTHREGDGVAAVCVGRKL